MLKGEDNIQIVYHSRKNRINKAAWIPTFFLPTSTSLGRILEPGTYQIDANISEMFHNFILNADVHTFCSVNVTGLDLFDKVMDRNRWHRL